jgi:hypothetical protein
MATIYYREDGKAFRGTIPPKKDWPFGSRQVIRRGMTGMYFNIFSNLNVSRRVRRAMARSKMHRVYAATKLEQLNNGIIGNLPVPNKQSWLTALAKKAKEIFTLEG